MSTATAVATPAAGQGFWTRDRKLGATLLAAGLVAAAAFGVLAPPHTARFSFTETAEGASVSLDGQVGAVLFGLLAAAGGALLAVLAGPLLRARGALLGLSIVSVVVSFLCWQVADAPPGLRVLPLVDLARGTLLAALPLILGALAGVLCERSGVVNVAIEGQFLMGAFGGALVATMAGNVWIGLVAAAVGGVLLSLLLAVLAIRYLVDQVVLGVVLNLLALGLTGFLYERIMAPAQDTYNNPPLFATWRIPGLADLPLVGPVLFNANVFVYLALGLVVTIHVALFRTRWGLRTRAVGEHPAAADTVGVRVRGTRYLNVLLAGVVAGVGGAYFTLGSVGAFTKNITSGKGFIALAALIFGRWSPTGALLAALFFGFADKLATNLSSLNSLIPNQFLNMLPYLATILAVAGLVGKVRAPAADGKPYISG